MEKDMEGRYGRMDRQVAEIRRAWAGELPFEGAEPIGPSVVQPGGPPIPISSSRIRRDVATITSAVRRCSAVTLSGQSCIM